MVQLTVSPLVIVIVLGAKTKSWALTLFEPGGAGAAEGAGAWVGCGAAGGAAVGVGSPGATTAFTTTVPAIYLPSGVPCRVQ